MHLRRIWVHRVRSSVRGDVGEFAVDHPCLGCNGSTGLSLANVGRIDDNGRSIALGGKRIRAARMLLRRDVLAATKIPTAQGITEEQDTCERGEAEDREHHRSLGVSARPVDSWPRLSGPYAQAGMVKHLLCAEPKAARVGGRRKLRVDARTSSDPSWRQAETPGRCTYQQRL